MELITKEILYDKIISFQDMNFTIAVMNGKAGLINIKGEPLTEFIYDDLSDYYDSDEDSAGWMLYEDDYCQMRLNGKWGILNNYGEIIVDFQYEDEIDFYQLENNLIVKLNDKYLLLDSAGKVILDKYESIVPQINGYACVSNGENVGIINSNGELVVDCIYKWVEVSSSDYFVVWTHDGYEGIIDKNKTIILDCKYSSIKICTSKECKDVVFIANLNEKSALFNTQGVQLV